MESLGTIASFYKARFQWRDDELRQKFDALFRQYVLKRKQDILDSVALGISLEALLDEGKVNVNALPDNVKEAFQSAFPNISLESLNSRNAEEIEGLLNAWKGKLFEVEVRDQLNAGMRVGDWQLEPGQHAELAESATQPGWDLKIVDDGGAVADVVQLKATDSASYIQEALDRYPDVSIISTGNIADHLEALSNADLTNQEVTGRVHDAINGGDSASDGLLHAMPGSVILATEAYQIYKGEKTIAQGVESGGQRLAMSAVAGLVGAAASVVLGPAGWLVGVGARMWLGNKMQGSNDSKKAVIEKEINPHPRIKAPNGRGKKAFTELENITGRLLLEYKSS
jgi:hypothetical protein